MSESENQQDKLSERPPVGTLVDYVYGVSPDNPLDVEITIDDTGKIVIFHDKPFKEDIAWFEYHIAESKLDFIIGEEGKTQDIGVPLVPQMAKHMHNTHQILTVLMDDKTGDAQKGNYVPLIIHEY